MMYFFLLTSINFTDFVLAVKNCVAHLDVKNLVEINFSDKKMNLVNPVSHRGCFVLYFFLFVSVKEFTSSDAVSASVGTQKIELWKSCGTRLACVYAIQGQYSRCISFR